MAQSSKTLGMGIVTPVEVATSAAALAGRLRSHRTLSAMFTLTRNDFVDTCAVRRPFLLCEETSWMAALPDYLWTNKAFPILTSSLISKAAALWLDHSVQKPSSELYDSLKISIYITVCSGYSKAINATSHLQVVSI